MAQYIICLREVNVAFVPFEPRVFTVDTAVEYYNILTNKRGVKLERYAEQLATLCNTAFREGKGVNYFTKM